MNRLVPFVSLALIATGPGCTSKPDPVLAAFGNNLFSTNRIVFYASGKYEYYLAGVDDPDTLPKYPLVSGTYVRTATNYVVTIKVADLPSPRWPTRPVYRIIQHEGIEYLFDERGHSIITNYEKTKDARELRHAWRREGG
jgi:hypothetical protein